MNKCYCYETGQEFRSLTECANALGLKINQLSRSLNRNQYGEFGPYHIAYDPKAFELISEWKVPYPHLDLAVNAQGQIMKRSTGLIRKPTLDTQGYARIPITHNQQQIWFSVHRLVAQAFLEDYNENLEVDHINGIRSDNRVENLRMVDRNQNLTLRYQHRATINQEINRLIQSYGYEETLQKLKVL